MELMQLYDDALCLHPPPAGSPAVRLFINTANEIALLCKKNIEHENRLRRVENLADLAQNNPLWKALRSLRNLFR